MNGRRLLEQHGIEFVQAEITSIDPIPQDDPPRRMLEPSRRITSSSRRHRFTSRAVPGLVAAATLVESPDPPLAGPELGASPKITTTCTRISSTQPRTSSERLRRLVGHTEVTKGGDRRGDPAPAVGAKVVDFGQFPTDGNRRRQA
jgi:hypothetical protein